MRWKIKAQLNMTAVEKPNVHKEREVKPEEIAFKSHKISSDFKRPLICAYFPLLLLCLCMQRLCELSVARLEHAVSMQIIGPR